MADPAAIPSCAADRVQANTEMEPPGASREAELSKSSGRSLALRGATSSAGFSRPDATVTGSNWMNLLSLTNLPSSPYLFLDPAGEGEPARFYRAFMQ